MLSKLSKYCSARRSVAEINLLLRICSAVSSKSTPFDAKAQAHSIHIARLRPSKSADHRNFRNVETPALPAAAARMGGRPRAISTAIGPCACVPHVCMSAWVCFVLCFAVSLCRQLHSSEGVFLPEKLGQHGHRGVLVERYDPSIIWYAFFWQPAQCPSG